MTTTVPFTCPESDPVSLASQVLSEIARGMLPVWPSTQRFTGALALGMTILSRSRGPEVARAVAAAPHDGPVDWDRLLMAG